METCCVCLDEMNEHQYHKTLSCGHKIHFQCYRKLIFRKNMYIPCPLCREININIEKPSDDPFTNIRLLCSPKIGHVRCLCRTKKGTICKRKSKHFNYGFCYQHYPGSLKEDMYPLMVNFMYLILTQRNSWANKLRLFDIGKQLIVKYCDKHSETHDLLSYFYQFMSVNNIYQIKDYDEIYNYYQLKRPPSSWINYCIEKHIII
jgi:hypothetical protein